MNHRHHRAFTLIELVIAISLMVLVAGVLASIITIAGRAAESPESRTSGSLATSRLLTQILDELSLATSVDSVSSNKVEFTLADCTGDGLADALSYAWSGPGGTLTRTLNGVDTTIAQSVEEFGVVFTSRQHSTTVTGPNTESIERLLSSCTQFPTHSYAVTSTTSIVNYIRPPLPSSTVSWRPTRVELALASNSTADGTLTLHVHEAQPPARSGTLLCSVSVAESALPSTAAAHSFTLPVSTQLAPTSGIMLQLAGLSLLTPSATVYAKQTEIPERHGELATSGLLGVGWTSFPEGALLYRLYGRTTSPSTTTATSQRLIAAAARIRINSSVQSGSALLIAQPNAPVSTMVADETLVDSVLDLLESLLGGDGG